MRLLIPERLVLIDLLPKEGDYAALKELRKAKEILSLTTEELKEYEITSGDHTVSWNPKGQTYAPDLPLSEWAVTTVQEKLRKMNEEKKLTDREFPLYEKFIVAYDQV